MIATLSIPELLGIDATSIVVDRISEGVQVDLSPWPQAVARKIGHPSLLFWALYNEPLCVPILFRQKNDAPIDWTVTDGIGNTLLVAAIFEQPRFCQDIIAAGHPVDTLQTDGFRPLMTTRAMAEIRALLAETARRRLEAQIPDPVTPVKSSRRL